MQSPLIGGALPFERCYEDRSYFCHCHIFFLLCSTCVYLSRDSVPDSLVVAPVVVIVNIARDSAPQRACVILGIQVNIFPLDGPPKAFYPDIIQAPCPTVHTHLDLVLLTSLQPLFTGILTFLIGVDDFRNPMGSYGLFMYLDGICRIQRVVKAPADYAAYIRQFLHTNT